MRMLRWRNENRQRLHNFKTRLTLGANKNTANSVLFLPRMPMLCIAKRGAEGRLLACMLALERSV